MILHIPHFPVSVSLGVHDWEKRGPRLATVAAWVRLGGAAAASDALADTLDYVAAEAAIIRAAQARHYNLVEALAAAIGAALLAFPQAQEATVEVRKPGALEHAPWVSVTETYAK